LDHGGASVHQRRIATTAEVGINVNFNVTSKNYILAQFCNASEGKNCFGKPTVSFPRKMANVKKMFAQDLIR